MSRRTQQDPSKIAVVTVHGTGDTADSPDGDKWFQRGSTFSRALVEKLAAKGIEADIVPVMWSGANSSQGRERGASILARAVRKISKSYGGVHVIGHSHGGNVANEAASMLGWRLRKNHKPMLTSVSTVGTPFFRAQLGAAESFGGIAFLVITAISILALLFTALVVFLMLPTLHGDFDRYARDFLDMSQAAGENPTTEQVNEYAQTQVDEANLYKGFLTVMAALLPVSALALFFIFPLAVDGLWRIMRIRRRQNPDAKFFSLWHPNDEAIAFLQRVEELPIEPFPRWAIWRNSRTSAIVWGVRGVLMVFLLAILAWIASAAGVTVTDAHFTALGDMLGFNGVDIFGGMTMGDIAIFLFVVATLGAPLIFGFFYLLTRALLGMGLELVGRGWLNTSIASVLRGMAFGRDGDSRLGNVATQSHTYGVVPHVLDGDIAERMRKGASGAAAALIEKYRWALFTVGPDTNGAVSKLATDAMTWDSLIHTTYFDQPEVVDALANYIASEVEAARAASA
ncbi:MAG: hypothetical protein NW200_03730 [Hyphomonadaceae bacterium]|nr:hypothetical protein [Hyphomonadaceae bacterium]